MAIINFEKIYNNVKNLLNINQCRASALYNSLLGNEIQIDRYVGAFYIDPMSDDIPTQKLVDPDPFNQTEVNTWLVAQIRALRDAREEQRLSATEAALKLGYSASYFRGRPWRIPAFGLKGHRHSLSTWRAWNDKPEIERRIQWDNLPLDKRRKARGLP